MRKHLISLNEQRNDKYFIKIVIIKIKMYKYKHAMKGVVKKVIPDKVVEKMIVR